MARKPLSAAYIEAPAVSPRPFGLTSVASIQDSNDGHWLSGYEYEGASCGLATQAQALLCDTPVSKTVTTRGGTTLGYPVVLYTLYQCRIIADQARAQKYAMDTLAAGESAGLAKALTTEVLAATGVPLLTGGNDVFEKLAIMEQWALENLREQPVIHLRADVASLLQGALVRQGNHLETKIGSLVSVDLYEDIKPGGALPAPTATQTMGFVSGAVTILRGRAQINGPHRVGDTNDWNTLAERPYGVSVNCGAAAMLFDVGIYGSATT